MPTYASKCGSCGLDHIYVRKVDERNDVPECCGTPTGRVLTTPQLGAMNFGGHKGFHLADGTNRWIEDGPQYRRFLKDNNAVPAEEGAQIARHARIEADKADDKRLTDAVVTAIQKTHL
jgi:predicted nucleic acid-binding Zn ribbon protein